jgi:hypothetical protein
MDGSGLSLRVNGNDPSDRVRKLERVDFAGILKTKTKGFKI